MKLYLQAAAIVAAMIPIPAFASVAPVGYWCWAEIREAKGNNSKVVTNVHESRAFADLNDLGNWQTAVEQKWHAKMASRFTEERIFAQLCSTSVDVTLAQATETQSAFVKTAAYYHYPLIVDDMTN